MTTKELVKEILPEPWKRSTTDTLTEAVTTLRDQGVTDAMIVDVLSSVVGAMAGEYGE